MRLLAISDLHLGHPANRDNLASIGASPRDWLILAGDIGETEAHLTLAFEHARSRFAKVIWVPGNHELWTVDRTQGALRGDARYRALIELARRFGVITPEDPYPLWPESERPLFIVPMFLLYDYSFRPDDVPADKVIAWAAEESAVCTDEYLLHPTPYPDRAAWCAARVALTEARLRALPEGAETVLINHFPLRRAHARLPRVPRFAPWCGTRATETWPQRYRARAVVYGHLHIRRSFAEEGVQFHEVSLGYPQQWDQDLPMASYVRVILDMTRAR
jgi:3',5'-cyclic AMP phosphodiesterase CpdA